MMLALQATSWFAVSEVAPIAGFPQGILGAILPANSADFAVGNGNGGGGVGVGGGDVLSGDGGGLLVDDMPGVQKLYNVDMWLFASLHWLSLVAFLFIFSLSLLRATMHPQKCEYCCI
jgi:hypothetical protein